MKAPVAAVTGATGFLGAHLVAALAARGYTLRALTHRQVSHPLWPAGVEPVAGALSDTSSLRRLVAGADLVVHAAGLIKARDQAAFDAVNRGGALRLAEAAGEVAPGAQVILVSSLAARAPQVSAYAASKRAGEATMAARLGAALTVVRPPVIYGPWDRETLIFFKLAQRGIAPLFGRADARFAMIHVEDAAAAIVGLCGGEASGRTVALADARPEGYRPREILDAAALAVGTKLRFVPLPSWPLLAAAHAAQAVAQMSGGVAMLTPGKAREMLHGDWGIAAEELAPAHTKGEQPRPTFGLIEGFASAARWYRAAGWL